VGRAVKLDNGLHFSLPPSLIGRIDVSRLLREIEAVDYELETQSVRNPNASLTIPSLSRMLADTVTLNKIDLTSLNSRKELIRALRNVKEKAPMVQITFAVDADPKVIALVASWVRQNLHPYALLTIGLQPSIVGGCVVRTPDHIYDFSMRKSFKDQIPALVEQIKAVAG
jgi:hypothetical protein